MLRISMAQYLGKLGVDIWRIQLLGRWGSSAVLRYVRDSPLQNLHSLADLVMMQNGNVSGQALGVASSVPSPFDAIQSIEVEQLST